MLQLLCRSILGSVRMKVQNLPSKVTNVRHFCNARGEQFVKPRRILLVNTNVSNISRVLKREMSSKPSFKPSMKLQRLQASDGIPSRYELIYRTDVGNYFLGFQVLVFSGLAAICVVIGLNLFAKYGGTAEGSEEVRAPSIPLFDAVKPSESQAAPLQPSTDDLWEEDLETAFLILGVTLCMAFCTYRLLRQFPVRIYSAPSRHCYGVYYSPVIPGKKVLREFVAGTITPAGKANFLFRNQLYKDGGGNHLFLLENYFRTPSDFNDLLDSDYEESVPTK